VPSSRAEHRAKLEDTTLNEVKIKALSPDNGAAIRGIVRLFSHVYGDTFPLKGVYDPNFWGAQLGKRFISIVAEDRGDIVAHIALHRDATSPGDTILSLPVVDPAYRHSSTDITRAAMETVRRLARTQGWRSCTGFVYEGIRAMQTVPAAILHSKEVAILPGYLPEEPIKARGERLSRRHLVSERGSRRHALVTQRVFTPSSISATAPIHLPANHREICRLLYAPLGLKRTFAEPTGEAVGAQLPGIEKIYHRARGSYHLFLSPSALKSTRDIEPRSWNGHKALFAYVNLFDPGCPAMCRSLEDRGYRFCGIAPLLRGRDSVVFFKESEPYRDRSPFSSPRARMLSRYIETYDISQALDILIPADRISVVNVNRAPQLSHGEVRA
jgi:hypothetical protein